MSRSSAANVIDFEAFRQRKLRETRESNESAAMPMMAAAQPVMVPVWFCWVPAWTPVVG
jgi:hypothetical protein